jgi:hypothetical protein
MDLDIRGLKMPGASAVNYDEHISKNNESHGEHREPRIPNKNQQPPQEQNRSTEPPKVIEQPKPVEQPKRSQNIMDDDIFSSVVNVQPEPVQPIKQESSIFDMGLGGVSF